jgi:SagB-type dehydrogenase family enzyme
VELNLEKGLSEKITEACYGKQFVKTSAATFIWTLVPYRTIWRYGAGGCRDLLIEPGHVCQNLYLAAEAIGSGVCAITAFKDEEINSILGIDGMEQLVIYVATVGKKK